MNSRDEIIADAISELTGLVHEEMLEDNEKYAALQHTLSVQSEKVQTILDKLTAEENEQIASFRETNNELSSIHLNESYIRGAKDCVALLKKLGVI